MVQPLKKKDTYPSLLINRNMIQTKLLDPDPQLN